MAILEIIKHPDPRLRKKATAVTKFDRRTKQLVRDMIETMRDAAGLGLAGPQVGRSKRLFVYEDENGAEALINPEIVHSEGDVVGSEGCLSIPRLHGDVPRFAEVHITGLNRHGKRVRVEAEGLLARVLQHEIDHLDGVLFIDKAIQSTLHTISDEEEEERLAARQERRIQIDAPSEAQEAPALAE